MVRCMGSTRCVLDEERLAGVDLVHPRHVVDRIIGHASDQIPFPFLTLERINLRRVAE